MSIFRPDLSERPGPRYQALADALAEAIESGDLRPGTRLPARRDLAYDLGISVNTVAAAYLEAERHGLVIGEVGRGTFVLGKPSDSDTFLGRRPRNQIDLSICRPCFDRRHAPVIAEAFAELSRSTDMTPMLACRPIIGLDQHRQAAVPWLQRLGVSTTADEVILTNGCSHAMLVALATLTEPGTVAATESLTDHGIISLASVLKFRLIGLDTDDEGILPDRFEAACRQNGVSVLITTPNLNNPTSTLMGEDRRLAIAAIARRHDVAIVEDDVFGALLPTPPTPLRELAPERTYYITSFTKAAISGLRTGYLVAPSTDIQRLAARLRATSWMATPIVADMVSRMIGNGVMADIVAKQRAEIAARQRMVAEIFNDTDLRHHPNSLNVWLPLPEPLRTTNFVDAARLRGVALSSAEPFVVGRQSDPHAIRISVGAALSRSELAKALTIVAGLLSRAPEPQLLNL